VVRRLIRRAVRFGRDLGIHTNFCAAFSSSVVDLFSQTYPELEQKRELIAATLDAEETKFKATLERALRYYRRVVEGLRQEGRQTISGQEAFDLYETYGFPLQFTVELAKEEGLAVDEAGFETCYRAHRQDSRDALDEKFKGGLADHSEQTTRLHTASHLLQAALRQVLGPGVHQMGSNITPERLRFDFSHPEKVTPEQLARVESIVNAQIQADLPVSLQIMPLAQAVESGALAFFGEKYGELVKVYTMGAFSKEVCGGPHVQHTGELGRFRILKEEAVGRGVRRIRAVLE
jgi:alanyl-tRNA synthetase